MGTKGQHEVFVFWNYIYNKIGIKIPQQPWNDKWATSRENLSSGVSHKASFKPVSLALETS